MGKTKFRDEHGRSIRDLKRLRKEINPNGTTIRQLLTAEIKKLQAKRLQVYGFIPLPKVKKDKSISLSPGTWTVDGKVSFKHTINKLGRHILSIGDKS